MYPPFAVYFTYLFIGLSFLESQNNVLVSHLQLFRRFYSDTWQNLLEIIFFFVFGSIAQSQSLPCFVCDASSCSCCSLLGIPCTFPQKEDCLSIIPHVLEKPKQYLRFHLQMVADKTSLCHNRKEQIVHFYLYWNTTVLSVKLLSLKSFIDIEDGDFSLQLHWCIKLICFIPFYLFCLNLRLIFSMTY